MHCGDNAVAPETKRMTEFSALSVVMVPSEIGQGSIRMCSLARM